MQNNVRKKGKDWHENETNKNDSKTKNINKNEEGK